MPTWSEGYPARSKTVVHAARRLSAGTVTVAGPPSEEEQEVAVAGDESAFVAGAPVERAT